MAMWCFTAQPCCFEQEDVQEWVFAVEFDEEEGWSRCQLVTQLRGVCPAPAGATYLGPVPLRPISFST